MAINEAIIFNAPVHNLRGTGSERKLASFAQDFGVAPADLDPVDLQPRHVWLSSRDTRNVTTHEGAIARQILYSHARRPILLPIPHNHTMVVACQKRLSMPLTQRNARDSLILKPGRIISFPSWFLPIVYFGRIFQKSIRVNAALHG